MYLIPNFIKVALRNIRQKPVFALINITGLAVGIACSMLVLLYAYDEYSYDRHHRNADRIYRLNVDVHTPTETTRQAVSSVLMGPTLAGDFPAIESMVRFIGTSGRFQYGDEVFYEGNILYADSTVFDIFSFELIRGNPETALAHPRGVVMTEALARKFFGDEDPMGKTLQVLDKETEVTVTGILKEQPRTSRFQFDMLMAMQTNHDTNSWSDDEWFVSMYNTYFLLSEQAAADPAALEAQFPAALERYIGSEMRESEKTYELSLQPLTDIYLNSNHIYQIGPASDATTVAIFSVAGLLILLIACINFMNLATARSMSRAREVGIRKTAGGHRLQLAAQFLTEALLMSLLALAFAWMLCILLLPLFNQFSGKEIGTELFYRGSFLLTFLGIGLFAGLLSGLYPAAVLSRFNPAEVLRGTRFGSAGGQRLRKGLVIFQFGLSVLLIFGTLVIRNQIEFMTGGNPGFNKEEMLIVDFQEDDRLRTKYETVKQAFSKHPAVKKAALSGRIPGHPANRSMTTFYRADGTQKKSNMNTYFIGFDFLDTYGLELIAGRNFMKNPPTDSQFRYIINRSALSRFGIDEDRPEEAIGRKMTQFSITGPVVGVVEDFHFRSMHHPIKPISLIIYPWGSSFLSLDVNTAGLSDTIGDLSEIWEGFAPDVPFKYIFLEDYLNSLYEKERKFSRIVFAFTLLAIFIAGLGLLGLTGYTVEKRAKEISLRKVAGADVSDILLLLTRQYLRLISIAALIALPAGWYLAQQWLQNFAYKAPLGAGPFLLSALILLGITLLVVSGLTVRAALRNPVEALRTE